MHTDSGFSRREMLRRSGMGFGRAGARAIAGRRAGTRRPRPRISPLAAAAPHFPVKAKHVIHLFMNGGPSQVDTFDPKPALEKYAGRICRSRSARPNARPAWRCLRRSSSRNMASRASRSANCFPTCGKMIDDMAVIRSMHADVPNHEPSLMLMNCGEARLVRPSMGSWLTYGLGTENQNLPGFMAMCPGGYPIQESQNWQAGFLPGVYQGTYIDTQHTEIDKLIENMRRTNT